MKSIKKNLDKQFLILWGCVAIILVVSLIVVGIKYSPIKKGQDFIISVMQEEYGMFDDSDSRGERLDYLFDYFLGGGYLSSATRSDLNDEFGDVLDGNGYKITLNNKATQDTRFNVMGLFNYLTASAELKNLYIDFDGVICNTIEVTYDMMKRLNIDLNDNKKVQKYYRDLNWDELLSKCTIINNAFEKNQNETLKYTTDPIVSSDIISTSCGALVDGGLTNIVEYNGKQLIKVVAWYDNEMGYSYQMVRTINKLLNN